MSAEPTLGPKLHALHPRPSTAQTALNSPIHRALVARLGADRVHFDSGHRAAYASDASNYRQPPIGVVQPLNLDEFTTTIAVCAEHDMPVLARGAGTSQSGQTVNEAIIVDISRHCKQIVELDAVGRTATIEPGVICDQLRDAAEVHGLTFGPDPATHSRCTLGGMIGNNSCGAHSVMAGKTVENVEALEVLTYDGARFWVGPTTDEEYQAIVSKPGRQAEIYRQLRALRDEYATLIRSRYPNIKRRVSGYNLDQLLPENGFNVARALVGSEGTCAFTLRAKVKLVTSPPYRVMLVLGFPDIYAAADAAPEAVERGTIATEGLDHTMIDGLRQRGLCATEIALLPPGQGWLLLEFGGDTVAAAVAQAQAAQAHFSQRTHGPQPSSVVVPNPAQQALLWKIRETGASATALSIDPQRPDPQVGFEDAAVDPLRLGDYLRSFQAVVDRYGYQTCLYGHFGDGCVHARITFDLKTPQGVQHWRAFIREVSELVVAYGGSLSGEHGDGQSHAELLPLMYGPELMAAMEKFKRIWDPRHRLNPGKLVHPYRMDEHLRMGPSYKPVTLHTQLQFRSPEGHGFQRAVERCIGMGKCRSQQGGTMCPSYRATGDERHSTRGRAHLLWEMLQGEIIQDGFNSQEVKEALEGCLGCKGCRSDCPTHTDMASYKAEFLHQHHDVAGHPRGRQAWSVGRMGDWAPLASRLSRLINPMLQHPILGRWASHLAGLTTSRSLPAFAHRTARQQFRSMHGGWLARCATADNTAPRPTVLLWLDTFSDHFEPDVALAAIDVLHDAGFDVALPSKRLCCGRPLYDFGLLEQAKSRLRNVLHAVVDGMGLGTPFGPVAMVGLEPGCMSVFKDELLKLLPDDPRTHQVANRAYLLSEWLLQTGYEPPKATWNIAIHNHCHHNSLFDKKADFALMVKAGANVELLDSGCCGMAGGYGYHPEHAETSRKIANLGLLPSVNKFLNSGANQTHPEGSTHSKSQSLLLANGFSCRKQLKDGLKDEQRLGRVVHTAQALKQLLNQTSDANDR